MAAAAADSAAGCRVVSELFNIDDSRHAPTPHITAASFRRRSTVAAASSDAAVAAAAV